MLWFAHDAAIPDGRWESHRDGVEGPILHQRLDLSHHFARRHRRTGSVFQPLAARNQHLYIGTTNVDGKDSLLHYLSDFVAPVVALSSTTAIGTSRSARRFFVEPPSFFIRSRDTSRNCHCACRRGSVPSGFRRRYVPSACNSRALTRSFRSAGITLLMTWSRNAGVSIGKASSIRR